MIFENQVRKIYQKTLFVRNDNSDGIFYFGPGDFPGLQCHPYTFPAKAGHTLKGYFYHYPNPIPGRLVVFDHGMGNGHRAYMQEIARTAKAGYLVFSYDHTGCMESGGSGTNGFAQSLSDLDACLTALEKEESLADRSISVMGHSWGGFSTMNIAALHPAITHIVSMSGFISVEKMLEQTFAGPMKGYREPIFQLERRVNPDYVNFNAIHTLSETAAKVLLIYSADDSVIHKSFHFDPLEKALAGKENIHFLLLDGKDHNPTYTTDAVAYKNAFFAELKRARKHHQLSTPEKQHAFMSRFDWQRMTRQDEALWNAIFAHLES